jgi:hypothetical protein
MMLRIIEMRGRMLGFFDKERAAGRFTITQDTPEGPRALSLEFVLPSGERFSALDALPAPGRNHASPTDHDDQHDARHTDHTIQHRSSAAASSSAASSSMVPSPTRITPRPDDLVLDAVQPSAFKKQRGGFDWS